MQLTFCLALEDRAIATFLALHMLCEVVAPRQMGLAKVQFPVRPEQLLYRTGTKSSRIIILSVPLRDVI